MPTYQPPLAKQVPSFASSHRTNIWGANVPHAEYRTCMCYEASHRPMRHSSGHRTAVMRRQLAMCRLPQHKGKDSGSWAVCTCTLSRGVARQVCLLLCLVFGTLRKESLSYNKRELSWKPGKGRDSKIPFSQIHRINRPSRIGNLSVDRKAETVGKNLVLCR